MWAGGSSDKVSVRLAVQNYGQKFVRRAVSAVTSSLHSGLN